MNVTTAEPWVYDYFKRIEFYDKIDILDNEQMIKFNDAMKNDFLTKQRKCDGVLKIFEIDKRTFGELVDFFDFCTKDIGN